VHNCDDSSAFMAMPSPTTRVAGAGSIVLPSETKYLLDRYGVKPDAICRSSSHLRRAHSLGLLSGRPCSGRTTSRGLAHAVRLGQTPTSPPHSLGTLSPETRGLLSSLSPAVGFVDDEVAFPMSLVRESISMDENSRVANKRLVAGEGKPQRRCVRAEKVEEEVEQVEDLEEDEDESEDGEQDRGCAGSIFSLQELRRFVRGQPLHNGSAIPRASTAPLHRAVGSRMQPRKRPLTSVSMPEHCGTAESTSSSVPINRATNHRHAASFENRRASRHPRCGFASGFQRQESYTSVSDDSYDNDVNTDNVSPLPTCGWAGRTSEEPPSLEQENPQRTQGTRSKNSRARDKRGLNPFVEYKQKEKRLKFERRWLQEDPVYMTERTQGLRLNTVQTRLQRQSMSSSELYEDAVYFGNYSMGLRGFLAGKAEAEAQRVEARGSSSEHTGKLRDAVRQSVYQEDTGCRSHRGGFSTACVRSVKRLQHSLNDSFQKMDMLRCRMDNLEFIETTVVDHEPKQTDKVRRTLGFNVVNDFLEKYRKSQWENTVHERNDLQPGSFASGADIGAAMSPVGTPKPGRRSKSSPAGQHGGRPR